MSEQTASNQEFWDVINAGEGWSLVRAAKPSMPEGICVYHTLGLLRYGLPEVALYGIIDPTESVIHESYKRLLDIAFHRMATGSLNVYEGDTLFGLFLTPVQAYKVDDERIPSELPMVSQYAQRIGREPSCLQIVLPDVACRFPWEAGVVPFYKESQNLLFDRKREQVKLDFSAYSGPVLSRQKMPYINPEGELFDDAEIGEVIEDMLRSMGDDGSED